MKITNEYADPPVDRHLLKTIKCEEFLTNEMDRAGLNRHSLKAQFTVIDHCFRKNAIAIGDQISKARTANPAAPSDDEKKTLEAQLDALVSMSNVLLCYAHRRVEFFRNEKAFAITGSQLFSWSRDRACAHLHTVDVGCGQDATPDATCK
jgi:hypothetical protein